MDKSKAAQSPMERYNATLLAQIDDQLQRSFEAGLQADKYYVIKTHTHGVLSVLSSAMVNDEHDVVFGPESFAACIEYVNANLAIQVTKEAKSIHDQPDGHRDGHPLHER